MTTQADTRDSPPRRLCARRRRPAPTTRSSSATSTRWATTPGSSPRSPAPRRRPRTSARQLLDQDVQFDANLAITTFDTDVGDGVKGIAIVVPDKALGPRGGARRPRTPASPLIAVDDDIYFKDGSPVPYVGMNAGNIGKQVGEEVARIVQGRGLGQGRSRSGSAAIEDQQGRHLHAAQPRRARRLSSPPCPDFDKQNIVRVPYDNTMVNAIDVMTTTLTANPASSTGFSIPATTTACWARCGRRRTPGMKPDQVIGIGIDGSPAPARRSAPASPPASAARCGSIRPSTARPRSSPSTTRRERQAAARSPTPARDLRSARATSSRLQGPAGCK